jgi:hypothetical protein
MDTMSVTVEQGTLDRLSELARCLSLLEEITPSAVDLRQFVGGLKQGTPALDLRFLVTDGASDQRISLEPGNFELELVTAVRALDRSHHFVGNTLG